MLRFSSLPLCVLPPPLPNQRVSEAWSKERGHGYVCIVRVWLEERQLSSKVAPLHWFILWWEKQSDRTAAYSRQGQSPVELSECSQEKARLLKRVTIFLHWSTNCKTHKCNCILDRGRYRLLNEFHKREVSVREAWPTAARPLPGLSDGSPGNRCAWWAALARKVKQGGIFFFIICYKSL